MVQGAAPHINVKFGRQLFVGTVPEPMFGMRALHLFFIKLGTTINKATQNTLQFKKHNYPTHPNQTLI
jgi:hypothetical protein